MGTRLVGSWVLGRRTACSNEIKFVDVPVGAQCSTLSVGIVCACILGEVPREPLDIHARSAQGLCERIPVQTPRI